MSKVLSALPPAAYTPSSPRLEYRTAALTDVLTGLRTGPISAESLSSSPRQRTTSLKLHLIETDKASNPDTTPAAEMQLAALPTGPVASTSAPPLPAARPNGKSKAVPQFVNLPNVAPRSYTILKEVGDGSFGTVWLADWHSPLECASLQPFLSS